MKTYHDRSKQIYIRDKWFHAELRNEFIVDCFQANTNDEAMVACIGA